MMHEKLKRKALAPSETPIATITPEAPAVNIKQESEFAPPAYKKRKLN